MLWDINSSFYSNKNATQNSPEPGWYVRMAGYNHLSAARQSMGEGELLLYVRVFSDTIQRTHA
jgi:hypothetical protein